MQHQNQSGHVGSLPHTQTSAIIHTNQHAAYYQQIYDKVKTGIKNNIDRIDWHKYQKLFEKAAKPVVFSIIVRAITMAIVETTKAWPEHMKQAMLAKFSIDWVIWIIPFCLNAIAAHSKKNAYKIMANIFNSFVSAAISYIFILQLSAKTVTAIILKNNPDIINIDNSIAYAIIAGVATISGFVAIAHNPDLIKYAENKFPNKKKFITLGKFLAFGIRNFAIYYGGLNLSRRYVLKAGRIDPPSSPLEVINNDVAPLGSTALTLAAATTTGETSISYKHIGMNFTQMMLSFAFIIISWLTVETLFSATEEDTLPNAIISISWATLALNFLLGLIYFSYELRNNVSGTSAINSTTSSRNQNRRVDRFIHLFPCFSRQGNTNPSSSTPLLNPKPLDPTIHIVNNV